MAQALSTVSDSAILKSNPRLTGRIGSHSYEIAEANLLVTDGKENFRAPLAWAFGQGKIGQTYLYQRDGRWYESRASYYSAISGLDITIGQQNLKPNNLIEAAGRLMGPGEVRQCFDCHATGVTQTQPQPQSAGVQCERCHGPSEVHLQAGGTMRKLGKFSTEEQLDFCGQCHRTWSQIAAAGPRGIQNVRFQPYRLAGSKCYDAADSRIRCTACHDPHSPLETSGVFYDAKCTACHGVKVALPSAPICRVATKDCVTCHMPQLELPGAHRKFTDHRIRIAKAGEAYPD